MQTKPRKPAAAPREAPTYAVAAAIAVLVLALGAGGYYAYNGGWKTAGQQREEYKHTFLPIMAAKHGDTSALEQENKLRAQQGRSPLEIPKDRKQQPGNTHEKLMQLQQELGGGQGQSAGQ